LDSQNVANLAVAGWSPHQYLQALKRYALPKNPKVVLFSFYAGNDFWQIRDFLQWKKHGTPLFAYSVGARSFPERYLLALSGIIQYIRAGIWVSCLGFVNGITQPSDYVDPDLAVLSLRGQTHTVRFVDHSMATEQILATEEWRELKRIVAEFKQMSLAHEVKPYLLYIPTGTSIYAEYSTKKSGQSWLQIRESQIARKENFENAIKDLAKEIQIELLNLSIPFAIAARNGQMLYEPIDDHWNDNGREVAARYVAERLTISHGTSTSLSQVRGEVGNP
jgi:hypothetical protein